MSDKKKDADLSDYVFGKVQPQAIPLEEAVLGAILLDEDALSVVLGILKPESFYTDAHQLIYRAILRLFDRSNPIDLLTVTEELKKSGDLDSIGGGYYLVELTNRVGSSANIEYHARIVAQKHVQRELIKFSTQIIRDSYEDTTDVFSLLNDAEKGIFGITQNNGTRKEAVTAASLASNSLNRLDEARKNKDGITGVTSGFYALDGITGGWQASDLIILGARPSQGKTALALNIAMNAAKSKVPVLVFSLEMSGPQLMDRLISSEARINGNSITRGRVTDDGVAQVTAAAEIIAELPIFVDDTAAIGIGECRSKCRQMKAKHGIGLVVVDYLQLMVGERKRGDSRDVEIGTISSGLKNIAKELGIPVIALSQISRDNEKRGGNKRPMLSDLRESGNIEQDADIVMFIHRPEYYGITEDSDGNNLRGVAEIIFAKHRNGAVGTEELVFESMYTLFSDKKKESFDPNRFVKKDVPISDPFAEPFVPQKVITVPSRMNDDEETPF